ncbi:MAG: hypothetical protein COV47_00510 [Candidatus Diapherotrites archaeon CG11_big_fil_rev_8_21_14_0_20_37_9]|nr:MAG: hypothetical protein COV47_00510 [Candidatus Diapherotrites archaeon CG11_big_fil_rev_8_21_14_0_20_37_9]
MEMNLKAGATIMALLIIVAALLLVINPVSKTQQAEDGKTNGATLENNFREENFLEFGLKTNTALRSIELSKILNGGPGKNGIPALHNPKFVQVNEKPRTVLDDTRGIVLGEEQPKFYPYNIIIWHEIVNDIVDGVPVAVTFCPLCGSASVFDRRIEGETLSFGVSGLLYQSNLLMYDSKTESLWSQVLGEAVVGDSTGTKLKLVPSGVVTFKEFSQLHPNGLVLSDDTGYVRNYSFNPYGDYESDSSIYFPVDGFDDKLPAKELVFAVPVENSMVVFVLSELNENRFAEINVGDRKMSVVIDNGVYLASLDGEEKPGFVAMYFSVNIHNKNLIVWQGK